MHTPLHRKLISMCRILRKEPAHWILTGSATVFVSEISDIVTTKRAIFSAFVGPIPKDQDVRSTCDYSRCMRPEHLRLQPSRRCSRSLSLPDQVAALAKPEVFQPPVHPSILPKDLTLAKIHAVGFLLKEKNSIAQVCLATGLTPTLVMQVRGGVFDAAAKNVVGARNSNRGLKRRVAAKVEGVADIPDDVLEGARTSGVGSLESGPVVPDGVEISEEEAAWLKQVGR